MASLHLSDTVRKVVVDYVKRIWLNLFCLLQTTWEKKPLKVTLSMIHNLIKRVKTVSIEVSVNYEKSQDECAKWNMQFREPSGAIREFKSGVGRNDSLLARRNEFPPSCWKVITAHYYTMHIIRHAPRRHPHTFKYSDDHTYTDRRTDWHTHTHTVPTNKHLPIVRQKYIIY